MSVCDIPEFKSPSVNIERKINFIFSIFLVEASYLVAYNGCKLNSRLGFETLSTEMLV